MAAADYFLKIAGIPGESEDKKNPNEIQLESWSWGQSNAGTFAFGGGGGGGKVNMQDFHFVMKMNKASPLLFVKCAGGDHIDEAVLTCRKATGVGGGQEAFLKITFSDLLISSYQTGGHGSGDVIPMDSISLNFAKIKMEYSPQDAKGVVGKTITQFHDLKKSSGG